MPKLFFLLLVFSISFYAVGQNNNSIEVAFSSRYDKHADYISRFGDRTYTEPMKLYGTSYGLRISYLFPLVQNFKFRVGAGYYKLGVDKVKRTSPWSSNVPSRTIDFNHPTGIEPAFHTDKYHYNNVALSADFRYEKHLNDRIILTTGADFSYYYTFSQVYRITYDNTKYKSKNARTLGFGATTNVGILKKFNQDKYYINPAVVIPIYQQLKGDPVFREEESVQMTKWVNGIGITISIGKYF